MLKYLSIYLLICAYKLVNTYILINIYIIIINTHLSIYLSIYRIRMY